MVVSRLTPPAELLAVVGVAGLASNWPGDHHYRLRRPLPQIDPAMSCLWVIGGIWLLFWALVSFYPFLSPFPLYGGCLVVWLGYSLLQLRNDSRPLNRPGAKSVALFALPYLALGASYGAMLAGWLSGADLFWGLLWFFPPVAALDLLILAQGIRANAKLSSLLAVASLIGLSVMLTVCWWLTVSTN